MSKKIIPIRGIHLDKLKKASKNKDFLLCRCKSNLSKCIWPLCICEECLDFSESCVCKNVEKRN